MYPGGIYINSYIVRIIEFRKKDAMRATRVCSGVSSWGNTKCNRRGAVEVPVQGGFLCNGFSIDFYQERRNHEQSLDVVVIFRGLAV